MLSSDSRWRVRALADAVVVEDASSGAVLHRHPSTALAGGATSTVNALHALPRRHSMLISFDTLPELWEISFDPQAPPIFNGLVHDYKMGEAIALAGFLNPRRTVLAAPLRGLVFDDTQAWVLGRVADSALAPEGLNRLHLLQLDIRLRTAEHRVKGQPDTAAAAFTLRGGRRGFLVPDAAGGSPHWVDLGAP